MPDEIIYREGALTFPEIGSEFASIGSRNLGYLIAATVVMTVGLSAWDLLTNNQAQFLPQLVMNILGQCLVVERLLADRLPGGRGARRYGSIFGVSFLTGLGIALSALLLLLPAIYVTGRWSVAIQAVIAEDRGATDAMQQSWDRTGPSQWLLFAVYLAAMVIFVGGTVGLLAFTGEWAALFDVDATEPVLTTTSILAVNALLVVFSVASWMLSTAIYRCMTTTTGELDSVFA
ncbi:MAG: glycerophosphoryl diester phosphodiesterase membrane domain-containing protein [Novosphingobium sp.]